MRPRPVTAHDVLFIYLNTTRQQEVTSPNQQSNESMVHKSKGNLAHVLWGPIALRTLRGRSWQSGWTDTTKSGEYRCMASLKRPKFWKESILPFRYRVGGNRAYSYIARHTKGFFAAYCVCAVVFVFADGCVDAGGGGGRADEKIESLLLPRDRVRACVRRCHHTSEAVF